jgi:hypothetical protein
VAANDWCDGIQPPPTIWFGAPNDPQIVRDLNGNASGPLCGSATQIHCRFRLPEVAVGEHQYIPYDPSYENGTFLGIFRAIGGGHVDLTGNFTDHDDYVSQVTAHARALQDGGYLLGEDADAIILEAQQSDIGK